MVQPRMPGLESQMERDLGGWDDPITWIHRHYCATVEEGLREARLAHKYTDAILYIVEDKVSKGFEKYWPHSTYWRVTNLKPYYGKASGAFYHPKPNHWVIDGILEYFEAGETPEQAEKNMKKVYLEFMKANNMKPKPFGWRL